MTDYKATPDQWAMLQEQNAPEYDSTILELRARVEALEADRWLRQHAKPAESNYPEKPDSSLVDRVLLEIENGTACDRKSARIAREVILSIATWVDRLGYHSCAAELRKEIPQSL